MSEKSAPPKWLYALLGLTFVWDAYRAIFPNKWTRQEWRKSHPNAEWWRAWTLK